MSDPETGTAKPRPRRRLLPKICLAVVAFLISFGLAELAFRYLQPVAQAYSVASTGNQYQFYKFDPRLGWANAPQHVGSFQREEFSYRVSINEHGMRQRSVPKAKPAGTRRIAVLGDSFVWGIGVSDEERLTEVLDASLANTEVLNFGVSGYAPIQFMLMLDQVLEFDPDLVIVAFCLGNDFSDNVQFLRYGYFKPYGVLDESGALQIEGYPLPNTKSFGATHVPTVLGSRILAAVFPAERATSAAQRGLAKFTEDLVYESKAALSPEDASVLEAGLAINQAILAAIRDRVAAASKELLVVPVPTKREYNPKWEYGHVDRFHVAEATLQKSCVELKVPCLATVRELHGEDFWKRDGHWRPIGHRKMAAAIQRHLESQKAGW